MAKPDNWDTLDHKDQIAIAQRLIQSQRGHLIMGQALANAIKHMSKAEYPELSNIEDMEILAVLFEPWFSREMNPIDMDAIRIQLNEAYKG